MNITASLITGWREIMTEYRVEQHGNDPMWRNNSKNSSYSLWIYPSTIHCPFTSRSPVYLDFISWNPNLNMLPLYFLKNVLFRSNHIVTCLFLQVMALASYGGIWGREDSVYRCLPLSNWEQDENLPVETNQRHNVHWCQHFLCKDIPAVHYSPSRLFHGHSVKHSETLPLSSCWRSARCAL